MKRLALLALLTVAFAFRTDGGETVRTAADLVRALHGEKGGDVRFDLVGDVTYVSTNRVNEKTNVALTDDSGAVLVRTQNRRGCSTLPRPGARARFRGHVRKDGYGRAFAVLVRYDELSFGRPASPQTFTRAELYDGRHDFRLCRLSGTLRDVMRSEIDPHWLLLSVCNGEGRLLASVPMSGDDDFDRLEDRIGMRVEAEGISVPYDHSQLLAAGRLFKIAATDRITFPQDDRAAPPAPSVERIWLSPPSTLATLGLHSARGRVVAVWQPNRALLLTDAGVRVVLAFARGTVPPLPGACVEATGLPDSDFVRIVLSGATWREVDGPALAEEKPMPVSPSKLLTDPSGRRRIDCGYDGHAVSIVGVVRSLPHASGAQWLYVESDDGCLVPVDIASAPATLGDLEVGCRVAVAGICVLDMDAPHAQSAIPRIHGFTLNVVSPEGVTVLSRPPWWTGGRLLSLVGALAALLVGILIWNVSLRRLAARRGRELAKSEVAKVGSELRVLERTRLAVELHDSIAQNLTGIGLELDTAVRLARRGSAMVSGHLQTAATALKSCNAELRNCIWDLRQQTLEASDMADAIRQTLAPHLGNAALAVRFSIPRDRISDTTAHTLLRIVRELTVNAVRHGGATLVRVACVIDGDDLLFSVRDNGCGFDPDNCPGDEQGHYGLLGIRERISAYGGEFRIESEPGKGARAAVRMRIPRE